MTNAVEATPRLGPNWLMTALLLLAVVVVGPRSVDTLWQGVSGSGDAPHRIRDVALGVAGLAILATFAAGFVRANILGQPPVRIEGVGVRVAGRLVQWAETRRVRRGPRWLGPYLVIEIEPGALVGVRWIDVQLMQLNPFESGRYRSFWVTERQLGSRIAEALEHVPSEHLVA